MQSATKGMEFTSYLLIFLLHAESKCHRMESTESDTNAVLTTAFVHAQNVWKLVTTFFTRPDKKHAILFPHPVTPDHHDVPRYFSIYENSSPVTFDFRWNAELHALYCDENSAIELQIYNIDFWSYQSLFADKILVYLLISCFGTLGGQKRCPVEPFACHLNELSVFVLYIKYKRISAENQLLYFTDMNIFNCFDAHTEQMASTSLISDVLVNRMHSHARRNWLYYMTMSALYSRDAILFKLLRLTGSLSRLMTVIYFRESYPLQMRGYKSIRCLPARVNQWLHFYI